MRCSATVCFLTILTWIAIGFYVGGGYAGLSQTLELLTLYGPTKGRGNPALDDPPNMWVNPDTNNWEPIDANKPGNRVPQAFAAVQYFLIAWAAFMGINSIVLVIDSVRSRKAIQNRRYQGNRISDSSISCTAWLVGYCFALFLVWLIQACFAVLPLLEYRITMQRCWDLDNPSFGSAADGNICVDLIQYGLVLYKDTNDEGYAKVCGPSQTYSPPRGDLRGFCENYYPTFVAFILAFTGACLGTIVMMLFAINLGSNFAYLKVRRYEGAASAVKAPSSSRSPRKTPSRASHRSVSDRSQQFEPALRPGQPGYRYTYVPSAQQNGVNLYNPNYGSSIMEAEPPKPVPEVMSFQPYRPDDEEEIEMRTLTSEKEKALTYSEPGSDVGHHYSSNYARTPSPPPYDPGAGDYDRDDRRSEHSSSRHHHHRRRPKKRSERHGSNYEESTDDNSAGYNSSHRGPPRSTSRRSMRQRRRSVSDDDNESGRAASEDDYLSRPSGRRHHRHRSHRRESAARLYEDESPGSDFYESEDRSRMRSSKRY